MWSSATRDIADDYDVVTYSFNPDAELAYRAYITPLTRHIFSEMSGVIVTVILLTAVFSPLSSIFTEQCHDSGLSRR